MKLEIKNFSKRFDEKIVLDDISYTFERGKIYGLLGRNGAGKTTFFNCINQDIDKDNGEAFLHNEESGEITKLSPENIGYVSSTPIVPDFLTGREFLKFFMDVHIDEIKNPKPLDAYFDYMGIEVEDRGKLLKDYSHGMKNKMQMLVNFLTMPEVLLLDEPLTALDVVVAEEMKNLLRGIKQNSIIIFSTHIMDLALDLCDEIVLLNKGKLEEIQKENLGVTEFKDKIIDALRG